MITITSKKDGFRRCGIAHSAAPVEYPDDRFSPDELAALQNEPMLVVTVADGGDPEKAAKKSGKAKEDK